MSGYFVQRLAMHGCGVSKKLRDDGADRNTRKTEVAAGRVQIYYRRARCFREQSRPPRR